jgi:hypothetical protein
MPIALFYEQPVSPLKWAIGGHSSALSTLSAVAAAVVNASYSGFQRAFSNLRIDTKHKSQNNDVLCMTVEGIVLL